MHDYIASMSGETIGFLTSDSGEKPRVALRVILPVAMMISMQFHVKKNKPSMEIGWKQTYSQK